ncbi:MAG TPA: hypothetical protein PLS81_03350 [Deltaproteobacteria bacterium]|nr:hypothetical protein [Deltaproteobacteria bacterium]HOM28476.1 hypothetical protein [Deltaproteobacteria bacterium]HPP80546.1 hypothetical protein [Deltaproteobacteria bacterium]
MELSRQVREYLEQEGKSVFIASSDAQGRVNVAMFGSVRLAPDGMVELMLGDNRTWSNLKENGSAACMVTMHGTSGLSTKGCRLYLRLAEAKDEGADVEAFRERLAARIGKAADMMRHLVRFEVVEARPIIDLGQGV